MNGHNKKPNVILVITDDQGYGDLGCHGNEIIQTPHIDRFHSQSVRLTDFHVGPTCAPTRAGLLTGHYCNCTGVWHTIMGRSLLRADETTVADIFRRGGYRTGMFGKWHLGDNHPFHPHERGFDEALYHGGGGISQTPDWWGNDYFDDTYWRNGVPEAFEGYCTDVWFREAMHWIDRQGDAPFFCYIPTNAPHGPYNIDDKYADPYRGKVPEDRARFYGMISNIDENFGKLREFLSHKGLEDNTILIWMTDNGTSCGCKMGPGQFIEEGYNAGLRGVKGSEYDGGHRVPIFMRWPQGDLEGGRDVDTLTANVDFAPTMIDLCGLETPSGVRFHGVSIKPLLYEEDVEWPDRAIVTDSQRVEYPIKWRKSATMTQRWRLVNGRELYDIQADWGQEHDIAAEHPEVVERLRGEYEKWWDLVSQKFDDDCPIVLGSDAEPESILTSHDWHGEECAWNQAQVRKGHECNGYWIVEVAQGGEYEFELRRWPRQEDRALVEGIPGATIDLYHGGRAMPFERARIRVGSMEEQSAVGASEKSASFTFRLDPGVTRVQTWLADKSGDLETGAYFVYVRRQ